MATLVTAWKAGSAATTGTRPGAPAAAWNNPTFVFVLDTNRASISLGAGSFTNWLRITGFGFTAADIPSDSAILGVELEVVRRRDAVVIADSAVYIRALSLGVLGPKLDSSVWAAADTRAVYGGPTDLWNATTAIKRSDVLDSGFGVDLSAQAVGGTGTPQVNYVQIRVYYGPPTERGLYRRISDRDIDQIVPLPTVSDAFEVDGPLA